MNKTINHWCKVCGVGYFACNDCDRKDYITWRAVACTPEHFQAYMVLHDYDSGIVDKAKAKELLEQLVDVEGLENYPESARKPLQEIFAKDKVETEAQKQNEVAPVTVKKAVPVANTAKTANMTKATTVRK